MNPKVILALIIVCTTLHAEERGHITARPCPWSCTISGISVGNCRDWREGSTCYVEDVSKRSQSSPGINSGAHGWTQIDRESSGTIIYMPSTSGTSTGTIHPGRSCERLKGTNIAAPRVFIERIEKAGISFEGNYRVKGTVEGICIIEAGVFKEGRKVRAIGVSAQPNFYRYPFSVLIKKDENPQIRVYNINGESDIAPVF